MALIRPTDDASYIFRYIGDMWGLLPAKDKLILSNFWASLVKITGDLQMKSFELDLSVSVIDVPVFNDERWSFFTLDSSTILSPSPSGPYPYSYFLGDSRIVSIPSLQERIDAPKHILLENVDYIIKDNLIMFKADPTTLFYDSSKPILWAKDTFLNKNIPYRNFGALIDLFQENSENYLRVLQGVWYAYWTGPRINNITTSLYLLMALPTAPFDSTITNEYTDVDGFLHVVVGDTSENMEDFLIPKGLDYLYPVGTKVLKFTPLCTGIKVIDKKTDPDFMSTEVGRQGIQKYLTQNATKGLGDTDETKAMSLLREHLWVSQISGDAFVASVDVPAIRQFLSTIKPSYTDFVFQMLRLLDDYYSFTDQIDSKQIFIDITVNTENSPVNLIDDVRYDEYVNLGNENLDIDMDSMFFTEQTFIDVYQGGTLIDTVEAMI